MKEVCLATCPLHAKVEGTTDSVVSHRGASEHKGKSWRSQAAWAKNIYLTTECYFKVQGSQTPLALQICASKGSNFEGSLRIKCLMNSISSASSGWCSWQQKQGGDGGEWLQPEHNLCFQVPSGSLLSPVLHNPPFLHLPATSYWHPYMSSSLPELATSLSPVSKTIIVLYLMHCTNCYRI